MTQEEDTDFNVANGREGQTSETVIQLGEESYDDRSFWWLQGETEQGKKTPTEFTRETLPMVGWRILLCCKVNDKDKAQRSLSRTG